MINMFKRALLALSLLLPAPALAGVPCTLPFTLVNGTIADATQVMANYNALVTCLASAAAAGVNSDITVLSGLTTALSPAEGGSSLFAGTTTTGSANAQVLATATPNNFSFVNGYQVLFTAGFTNTGATTLNVNGTGAKNIFRRTPSGKEALTGGEIQSGSQYVVSYDGTQFEIQANSAEYGGFGPQTTLASATTTDLGTIPSHNITVSGTTTITSFGTTASATYPIYLVEFGGVLTLTHGANLILPGAANITTQGGDNLIARSFGTGWKVISYTKNDGKATVQPSAPTKQYLLSGTGATYTTPANAREIVVQIIGGGGGGGAATANTGSTGGTTSFNSITAVGGTGGTANSIIGGVGGTGGTGTAPLRVQGNAGFPACLSCTTTFGGNGGGGPFGGGGRNAANAVVPTASAANSGAGGAGASNSATAGAGGGAGEYAEFSITTPAATYTYTVGASGAGGTAGTTAGGAGGSGLILVTEYYLRQPRCEAVNDNDALELDMCKAA